MKVNKQVIVEVAIIPEMEWYRLSIDLKRPVSRKIQAFFIVIKLIEYWNFNQYKKLKYSKLCLLCFQWI